MNSPRRRLVPCPAHAALRRAGPDRPRSRTLDSLPRYSEPSIHGRQTCNTLISKAPAVLQRRLCAPILPISIDLFDDGRDPHGGEAHALDVVELRDQSLPCPSAIDLVRWVALRRGREIGPGEPISYNLIDGLLPPFSSRKGGNPMFSQEGSGQEKESLTEDTHRGSWILHSGVDEVVPRYSRYGQERNKRSRACPLCIKHHGRAPASPRARARRRIKASSSRGPRR